MQLTDIFLFREKEDLAVIMFRPGDLVIPDQPIELIDEARLLKVGVEVGWIGYPAISEDLCYFGGRISSRNGELNRYLVDGVAINGVSGGPAFHVKNQELRLVGVVSAYIPNRTTGDSLPGLAVLRTVRELHSVMRLARTLGQAKKAVEN